MSEETEDIPKEKQDAEFADVDESMSESISIEQARPSRFPLIVALLSLVLAVAALGGIGWLAMTRQSPVEPYVQDTSAIDSLTNTVSAAQRSMAQLRDQLGTLADRDVVTSRQLEDYQNQLERRMELYESLPGRMDNVEDTMAAIQGISAGVRDTWLLAEAEYYMQIANAQLQLAGNPRLARLALLQADERIRQLANPALTNVRRALANELRALETMDRPDIEGITLTLASLASVVESLPLRSDVTPTPADEDVADEELTGFDRAVESLKSTMSDVVSVRRTDETVRPLIAAESAYFLRANLSLQLQAARLAMLRTEKTVFQQSLDDAAVWLEEYYDADSSQVQGALQTIREIREAMIDIAAPDISESLRLLRQFSALASSAQSTAPAVEPEPLSAEETAAQPETEPEPEPSLESLQ